MIPLISQNGSVFVWNPEDWKTLRQTHRIVGNLLGSLPRAPFQNTFTGLPTVLLEEEVSLLLEKKLCKLLTYKSLSLSEDVKTKWEKHKTASKEEQAEYLITDRKRSITSKIDRIIEGKRKKLVIKKTTGQDDVNLQADPDLDKESVLKTELERVEQTPLTHSLVHIHTEDPWLDESNFIEVSDKWKYPSSEKESLRYRVFKDLWEKDYYITCGQKFGGDFLVYPGDPALYHAHYIILCKDSNESLPWLDIAVHCRVGSSARKTFVLASALDEKLLSYTSFQFESMTRCIM